MIISCILIFLAAICDAIMDTSVDHYSTSIFNTPKLNAKWWNGASSWMNKYINGNPNSGLVKWYFGLNKPVQLTDAFHFFKMWMIIFICGAIAFYHPITALVQYGWFIYPITILVLGTIWNLTFSLFYNKILIK